jgi:hypothetical protein
VKDVVDIEQMFESVHVVGHEDDVEVGDGFED